MRVQIYLLSYAEARLVRLRGLLGGGLLAVVVLVFAVILGSCGGTASDSGRSGPTGGATAPGLQVDVVRNTAPADGSFKVVYWQSSATGAVLPFSSTPLVVVIRGLVSASVIRGDGKREITVTPDAQKTGEYPITVTAVVSGQMVSVIRTAVVMGEVASGWGQPLSVAGLVNTAGTQDSLAVSPDGQYLFLQYYPVTLNCILSGNPGSAFCQAPLGPVVAPQRPNMPGASRVGVNSVHHGCPSLNFDPSPVPVPPIAMYGFRRQADGSYAEPFVFTFNGGDGCLAPWGPTVRPNGDGSYRMFTAFNDPRNAGTANDFAHIYDFSFTPGVTQLLGNFSYAGSVQLNNFALTPVSFLGASSHRGNPHVHYNGGMPSLLFYDDETKVAAQQFVYVSQWAGTAWSAATALNFAPFNTTGFGDTQPYFDGSQLILRNGSQLLSYAYNQGPMTSPASWAAPVTLLAPSNAAPQTGSVIVVGEPTVATIDGQDVLFFIYGLYQADGSVNLRAGYVRKGA